MPHADSTLSACAGRARIVCAMVGRSSSLSCACASRAERALVHSLHARPPQVSSTRRALLLRCANPRALALPVCLHVHVLTACVPLSQAPDLARRGRHVIQLLPLAAHGQAQARRLSGRRPSGERRPRWRRPRGRRLSGRPSGRGPRGRRCAGGRGVVWAAQSGSAASERATPARAQAARSGGGRGRRGVSASGSMSTCTCTASDVVLC